MQFRRSQGAFTLIEMVVTVSVLAILAAIAVPSFLNTLEKRRVVGAAEQLYADLQYARSEAIKGNRRVGIYFTPSTTSWCYGLDDDTTTACVCGAAEPNCTVDTVQKVFRSDGFRGVSLSSPLGFGGTGPDNETGFEPRRGQPMRTINSELAVGTVEFSSASQQLNVVLSAQGRIRLCSPTAKKVAGYPGCT